MSPEAPARIEQPLFRAARTVPDKTAVVDGERVCAYRSLAFRVAAFARRLADEGLVPGDRVCVFLGKSLESVVAIYGAWAAGGIAVPIFEGLRSRQVRHVAADCGARFFVSSERKVSFLEEGSLAAARLLEVDAAEPAAEVERRGELAPGREPATLLYTSGSTGPPKGIVVSHANLLAGTRIVSTYLQIDRSDRIISILPFSFDYGLNQLLTSVGANATLYLQRSHFAPDICRTLVSQRITGMAGVPSLWIDLMQGRSPFPSMSFPDLRYITNTGGVFPVELVERYRGQLPHVRIYLMYGLSEAFRSTYLPPDQVDVRPGSIGRAVPETRIHVLNETGTECAPDEIGELVHRGPTVALGYWNDPEASAAVFAADPFAPHSGETVVYSGDLVRRDEKGYLYFVGRRDQIIKSHGFRINPDEVEQVIFRSGLVREVVVHGAPDPVAGAVVVAHVRPRDPDTFTDEALVEFCRREMPRYMVPREIRVTRSALPRTTSGKIDRRAVAS